MFVVHKNIDYLQPHCILLYGMNTHIIPLLYIDDIPVVLMYCTPNTGVV